MAGWLSGWQLTPIQALLLQKWLIAAYKCYFGRCGAIVNVCQWPLNLKSYRMMNT
jgi:hypothetical protein